MKKLLFLTTFLVTNFCFAEKDIKQGAQDLQKTYQMQQMATNHNSEAEYALGLLSNCAYKQKISDLDPQQEIQQGACDSSLYYASGIPEVTEADLVEAIRIGISSASAQYNGNRADFKTLYDQVNLNLK